MRGNELHTDGPKSGMLIDYGDLSAVMRPFLDDVLDHHYLNESLAMESPTSEAVARWLYDMIQAKGVPVASVTIEETCSSRCVYDGE